MSQEDQSCLRFSLEESVWFQKGQEVSELVSISLDPNITIQEHEQYVSIQGSLKLAGEYRKNEEGELEESFASPKFIQSVEEREGGICEFSHHFPVDITIPNNRIGSVYDLDVYIDSFDYQFQERSCMRLTADLTITGLYGEQQHPAAEYDEEDAAQEHDERPEEEEAEAEAQEEEQQQDHFEPLLAAEEETEKELEPLFRSAAPAELIIEDNEEVQLPEYAGFKDSIYKAGAGAEEEEEEEDETENAEAADLFAPFTAEARKQPEEAEKEEKPAAFFDTIKDHELPVPEAAYHAEPAEQVPDHSFATFRSEKAAEDTYAGNQKPEMQPAEILTGFKAQQEESESSSDQAPKKKKAANKKKSKSLSLAEFLARKEEEQSARMKVCIVQHGDTLDIIAERYEVPVPALLRVNHLELNQDVYEGQVLYVPVHAYQK
ncbi:stage VI sporulation protein D [Bacillus infantis]|uniref:Stage VI sporulation protein D n=1 Tax=Bacillus infantis TaxID=324767 RepID=A0A5D4STU2_9BACI|nr:stage VI sporulation protein D [Bacillus infantis]TYS66131.1 stage VI sporulation protein D [Bacillus infantis]